MRACTRDLRSPASKMSADDPPEKRANRAEGYRSLFMDVFPQLVGELTEDDIGNTEISVGIQHLKEVCVTLYPHMLCIIFMATLAHFYRFWNTMFQEVIAAIEF